MGAFFQHHVAQERALVAIWQRVLVLQLQEVELEVRPYAEQANRLV